MYLACSSSGNNQEPIQLYLCHYVITSFVGDLSTLEIANLNQISEHSRTPSFMLVNWRGKWQWDIDLSDLRNFKV